MQIFRIIRLITLQVSQILNKKYLKCSDENILLKNILK